MRRPAYQHYPADWRNNTNLRRCSWAARGVWVEILGFMHDSDEYGILRWRLSEVGKAVGCPMGFVRELVFYGVLKGSDLVLDAPYIYTPISGRKRGPDVTLVPKQPGPIWFSSRMVRDEHIRITKGYGRRADDASPVPTPEPSPEPSPNPSPMPTIGEDIKGDTNAPQSERSSISSSSSSSLRSDKKQSRKRDVPVPMPPDFQISDRVKRWASGKGFDRLDERFEWFVGYVRANGKWYVDWDDAFMNSIRGDWAKLVGERRHGNVGPPASLAERRARNMDILTGKVVPNGGAVIEGVARTVDQPLVLPLSGDLREPDGDDVGRLGPERSAGGLG